ncbi:MAG: hypothetical protein N3D12_05855 [Candidatus Methanomethyliaceae archaeon]|nr:hypothetical protein [Candidatus Methanomethyliaceae archaeon]
MDDQAVHGKVLQEKAHKYGTIGWAIQPDGTIEYTLICDYKLIGFPFWILVASCEGAYYVTFWGQILP